MWNIANKLTMLRVLMVPVYVLVFGLVPQPWGRYLAFVIFAAASYTDHLDGKLARERHLITNFGKFMDPLADKLLVISALICFVENGQSVKKGDKLLEIDIDYLTANAPSLCSPILCTELEDNQKVRLLAEGEVKAGDPLFAVDVYEEEA